jgi:hypothetical protein
MANGLYIVKRAFRKIGVGQEGEDIQGEMVEDALSDLNFMIQEWRSNGIYFPDYTITLAGDLTFAPADLRALILNLAIELAPEYGESSQELMMQAKEAKTMMMHRYFAPGKISFDELPGVQRNESFYS